jgi:hypothetical protein
MAIATQIMAMQPLIVPYNLLVVQFGGIVVISIVWNVDSIDDGGQNIQQHGRQDGDYYKGHCRVLNLTPPTQSTVDSAAAAKPASIYTSFVVAAASSSS